MSTCRLPQELLDTTIDHLHADNDRRALKACAKASRMFRPRCQKYLFSTTTISFPRIPLKSTYDAARPLLDILIANPDIAKNIHHLRIVNYSEGYWIDDGEQIHDEQYMLRGFYNKPDATLPLLFTQLNSLDSFTFGGLHTIMDRSWLAKDRLPLSGELLNALIEMLARTKVPDVKLSMITDIPLAHIAIYCPNIERLSVRDKPWGRSPLGRPGGPHGVPITPPATSCPSDRELGRLKRLDFDEHSAYHVGILFKATVCGIPPHHTLAYLRELRIFGTAPDVDRLASKIIFGVAATLESFTWELTRTELRAFTTVIPNALRNCRNLRSLRIGFVPSNPQFSPALTWTTSLLRTISCRNSLDELAIAYPSIPRLDEELSDWASPLDVLLTSAECFPTLRKVTLISVDCSQSGLPLDAPPGLFPMLREKSQLMELKTTLRKWTELGTEGISCMAGSPSR
ncbi:hypothetical protein Hypma_013233 [Hypsizygus marmoreus]|uniref:F-box domain-containing protein n=1 Tax=Hypsizygus marmoreus TaxID=39966 RepID=A0A369JJ78_HYPMA|nr:hypothetical protein Hypma_013233 [Hypsizygus marmoreus]